MLPEQLNIMFSNFLAMGREIFELPIKFGNAIFGGGQRQWETMNYGYQNAAENSTAYGSHPGFPEGIWERRDKREGITPGEREMQKNQIAQKTSEAGIYVYVAPGAPEGDKGTIFF